MRPLVRPAHAVNQFRGNIQLGSQVGRREHWGIVHPLSIHSKTLNPGPSIGGMTLDPAPIENSRLAYTIDEAAAATGYSASTIRTAIRRNNLLARYANTKPVILIDELQDWLRSLPTEPKGGHRPLSIYADVDEGWPGPPEEPPPAVAQPAKAMFRTPEQVAPELGVSKSALRQFCRQSGIHTRVGKRMMLHEDDISRLVVWIREHQDKTDEWWSEPRHDPFA